MTHLEPAQIIEFVRGGGDRAQIEDHIDECDECRERIADAARHARGEASAPSVDDLTGTTIGRYRIGELLGAGGMGVVYLAEDTHLHRRVVIKLLRPDLEREGKFERFRARLLREAQAMAQLSHPNVVQVYDLGAFDNSIYVAMEYLDGGDLRAWLAEKPRATTEILALFIQAAHGLAAAHEVGIVHRDFKPANVVVGANGRAKVADFGLARPMHGVDDSDDATLSPDSHARPVGPLLSAITQVGALVGTPAYMAPEQAASEQVDARADQYSFCLALYQAIERVKPTEIVDASGAIRPPTKIPRHVWTAIRRGLSRRPGDRFASMPALIDALTPRSHVLLYAGIAVAAIGIGVATAWVLARTDTPACAVPPLRLPAIESDAIAYAEQWRAMYATTCSDPPKLAERRRACLAWRGRAFEALTDRVATMSKADVVELEPLSHHLEPLLPCTAEHTLALDPIAPPADLVPKILELRLRMARGDDPAAIAKDADALGYAPISAEAYLKLATTKPSIETYTHAIRAALTGNAVMTRSRALVGLARIAPEWSTFSSVASSRVVVSTETRATCRIDEPAERIHLALDTDASDAHAHPTKLLGDAAHWVDGHLRGALDFDGFNDAIDLGSPPDLDDLPEVTACAWIHPRSYPSSYPAILDKSTDTYLGGWNLYIQTDGTLGLLTPFRDWAEGGLVQLGRWHHVCATWNGKVGAASVALYIDGAEILARDTGTNYDDNDPPPTKRDSDANNALFIGRVNNDKYFFDGAIDDVRVWARAASWSEIMRLYDCSFSR